MQKIEPLGYDVTGLVSNERGPAVLTFSLVQRS